MNRKEYLPNDEHDETLDVLNNSMGMKFAYFLLELFQSVQDKINGIKKQFIDLSVSSDDEDNDIIYDNTANHIITSSSSFQSLPIQNISSSYKIIHENVRSDNHTGSLSQIKSFSFPTYTISSYEDMKLDHVLYTNPHPPPNYRNLHNQLKLLKIFQRWKECIKSQILLRNILKEWKYYISHYKVYNQFQIQYNKIMNYHLIKKCFTKLKNNIIRYNNINNIINERNNIKMIKLMINILREWSYYSHKQAVLISLSLSFISYKYQKQIHSVLIEWYDLYKYQKKIRKYANRWKGVVKCKKLMVKYTKQLVLGQWKELYNKQIGDLIKKEKLFVMKKYYKNWKINHQKNKLVYVIMRICYKHIMKKEFRKLCFEWKYKQYIEFKKLQIYTIWKKMYVNTTKIQQLQENRDYKYMKQGMLGFKINRMINYHLKLKMFSNWINYHEYNKIKIDNYTKIDQFHQKYQLIASICQWKYYLESRKTYRKIV